MAAKRKRRTKEEIDQANEARTDRAANRKTVARARGERRVVRQEIRTGERRARQNFREGNRACRTERQRRDAPHRDALRRSRDEFGTCRRGVERRTVEIITGLGPFEEQLRKLEAIIPAPLPNARVRHNQELWSQRLEGARHNLSAQHPELAPFFDTLLGPVGKFNSSAARALRAHTDRLVRGRPAMSIEEYVAQKAHEMGHTPESGIAGAPSLVRMAESQAARSVERMMREHAATGTPVTAQEIVQSVRAASSGGPSSAGYVPSRVTPSMTAFPMSTGYPRSSPGLPSHEIIASVQSHGPRSVRAPSSRRGAASARGSGPQSRAPTTQASPGSSPRSRRATSKRAGPKRTTKPRAPKGTSKSRAPRSKRGRGRDLKTGRFLPAK
jgi:hypothetical protein